MTGLAGSEAAWRLGAFAFVFMLLACAEHRAPKRNLGQPRLRRWTTNLGILLVDVLVQRLTVGAIVFGAGAWAQAEGTGLFNRLGWPFAVEAMLGFVALDLAVWAQHVASHRWPLLWRLHEVHHADEDVDVTTGIRFHPLEIVLSALWKALVVVALGIDPWAALVFEVVLNASSLFTHANAALPFRLDRALRWVVCTPDMHRIHHSVERREADSNYGFFLSVWDRAFRTMRDQPQSGHGAMRLGTTRTLGRKLGLIGSILLPFTRSDGRR
ncbi:MAG: sterol desaturase family protein [Methylobacterium mesophilicum]|nr:sterol desaturase family protein [Methylobacterium mesophilicum]